MGLCHLLPKRRQFDVQQKSTNSVIKFHQKMKITCIEQTCICFFVLCFITLNLHDLCGLIYWWHTPNRKGLQTNDTPIWIFTNVFLVAILFQLPQCIICVKTQISKAEMASAFVPVKSIATTIVPATRIRNHAFLYFMETVGMHSKLAIRYSPI